MGEVRDGTCKLRHRFAPLVLLFALLVIAFHTILKRVGFQQDFVDGICVTAFGLAHGVFLLALVLFSMPRRVEPSSEGLRTRLGYVRTRFVAWTDVEQVHLIGRGSVRLVFRTRGSLFVRRIAYWGDFLAMLRIILVASQKCNVSVSAYTRTGSPKAARCRRKVGSATRTAAGVPESPGGQT